MNTTILDQIIQPFAECLTPEAARKIVAIRADEELQGRVDALFKLYPHGIKKNGEPRKKPGRPRKVVV